ncbi:hypothetical protein STEG23_024149 [Scotinomys teguina]
MRAREQSIYYKKVFIAESSNSCQQGIKDNLPVCQERGILENTCLASRSITKKYDTYKEMSLSHWIQPVDNSTPSRHCPRERGHEDELVSSVSVTCKLRKEEKLTPVGCNSDLVT